MQEVHSLFGRLDLLYFETNFNLCVTIVKQYQFTAYGLIVVVICKSKISSVFLHCVKNTMNYVLHTPLQKEAFLQMSEEIGIYRYLYLSRRKMRILILSKFFIFSSFEFAIVESELKQIILGTNTAKKIENIL